ncbi:MAG TPA: asparagine synthase (glutamine-hydrolyzing) [Ktedonobacteraceae bacterium]|jgi:asparagine synthase (glutamine-hydrolysing)|nr:asparagine synthase (glutamine-hydrolyzing) [Ktedonobacteraceae bacterium]
MCGIVGCIDAEHSQEQAAQLIESMCHVIRHRGPDDQGTWVGDGVALGMRRLAIIDLTGGHQPIFNEDHSILVVCNGEIYNYRELKQQLQEKGHHFRTHSDSEAIIHAYEEYGDDCPQHLRGMFAFALWDRKHQRLLLARDRFGKKPLNYYWDGRRLIFGSEIKSILEAGIPRKVNHKALDEYLVYRYVPAPNTLFEQVMKLPAAHTLVYEQGTIRIQRYWDVSFAPTCCDDEASAIAHIRELIKDAVRVRLMSEVPLGAFLSGGIDSSVVVGMMSQMLSQPVKTFSIGFAEDDYSELPYARKVAEHFGTEHHEFFVKPDLISVLPQLVWDYDEPFGDSSIIPTYYVCKLAREHVTVVLTGDGGDEIFAGYQHYLRELALSRVPWIARQLLGAGSRLMPDGMRGKRRLRNINNGLPMRYVQGTMIFPVGTRAWMYQPDYFARVRDHDPYARQADQFTAVSHLDIVSQMQHVDAHNYLIDDIMVKVDKASMFNSLETRAPLLDQHLVAYIASLQPELRMRNHTLKYLLKRVGAELLPPEILMRKKQGFSIPMEHWFRKDLAGYAHDILESLRAQQRGIINPAFVQHILAAHQSTKMVNHSSAIWSLLCLELWFQTYMDSPGLHHERSAEIYSISKR